jgi:hypothetical protein
MIKLISQPIEIDVVEKGGLHPLDVENETIDLVVTSDRQCIRNVLVIAVSMGTLGSCLTMVLRSNEASSS